MDARTELMVIMMEECGELIQACSKALRKRVKKKRLKLSKWSSLIEEWEVERYSV